MFFNIEKIPFSRRGSYFAISKDIRENKIFIRDLHGGDMAPSNLYQLQFPEIAISELKIIATETRMRIQPEGSDFYVLITIGAFDTMHILIKGICMEMISVGGSYDSIIPSGTHRWEHFLYSKERKIMINCQYGSVESMGTWNITKTEHGGLRCMGHVEDTYIVLENYRTVWKEKTYPAFEEVQNDLSEEYNLWRLSMMPKNRAYVEQSELAAYLLWANFVKADGILPYDALYCSKNWMYNMWSWDNCFMAIALAESHPQNSYEQLSLFFEFQDESGCYPDFVNDRFTSYSCCKPPIHAWAYKKMREQNAYFNDRDRLLRAYESFKGVTNYWISYRIKENGLPEYNHGNDSGWDNASVFHQGFPVISPDLTAYLIRQLDILHEMAIELQLMEDAAIFKNQAEEFYEKLMMEHYEDGRFFATHLPSGERIREGDSLLMYIPFVIGYRLPKQVTDQLAADLEQRFEVTYGLCTENPESLYYKKGGYWLGPVWAPVSYILIDALRENGYGIMAKRLAGKFCQLPVIGLMAENFDPFTAEGYDDPGFSWTSSVFLQLLKEYPDMEEN